MKVSDLYKKKEIRNYHLEAILNKLKALNLSSEILDEIYYHSLKIRKPR